MTKKIDKGELDPLEYFKTLKNKKSKWNTKKLKLLQENTDTLLKKAHALGQVSVMRKLIFNVDIILKEKKLLNLGIDTFIYHEDINEFIDKISKKAIKMIELSKFPREIPDEISKKIIELKKKKIFDDFIVVFTDYTGKIEREVEEERRRKDPIIFGIFKKDMNVCNRFYYLADWEDEYCDLTLEKMVGEMSQKGIEVKHSVEQNVEIKDIRSYMNSLDESNRLLTNRLNRKKSFFEKVKLWLKR